jgi:hypothetical protein
VAFLLDEHCNDASVVINDPEIKVESIRQFGMIGNGKRIVKAYMLRGKYQYWNHFWIMWHKDDIHGFGLSLALTLSLSSISKC